VISIDNKPLNGWETLLTVLILAAAWMLTKFLVRTIRNSKGRAR
jgi:hypothetical protein